MTSRIGRLDVTQGIKRYFEVTGKTQFSVGEGIVPSIMVGDLSRPPFAPALGWAFTIDLVGGVGTFGAVELRVARTTGAQSLHDILTLETIAIHGAADEQVSVGVTDASLGLTPVQAPLPTKALEGKFDPLGQILVSAGATGVLFTSRWRVSKIGTGASITPNMPIWCVSGNGRIAIINVTANDTATISISGYYHQTSVV